MIYHNWREYSRVYEEVELTEAGPYKKDEAPASVQAKVTVEVVHAITLTDQGGQLYTQWFDIPEPSDTDDKVGGGYSLDGTVLVDHDWWPNAAGPSSVRSILLTKFSTRLNPTTKAAADQVKVIEVSDKGV